MIFMWDFLGPKLFPYPHLYTTRVYDKILSMEVSMKEIRT